MEGRRAKILILDDSELCRDVTQLLLEEQGYAVVTLASPGDLSRTLAAERPDLALVDVELPGLDGGDMVAAARHRGETQCPMVLFSGREEPELARLAQAVGAVGYIRKTADADELVASVARLLGATC